MVGYLLLLLIRLLLDSEDLWPIRSCLLSQIISCVSLLLYFVFFSVMFKVEQQKINFLFCSKLFELWLSANWDIKKCKQCRQKILTKN